MPKFLVSKKFAPLCSGLSSLIVLSCLLIPILPAFAAQTIDDLLGPKPSIGMKHIKPKPAPVPPPTQTQTDASPKKNEKPIVTLPQYAPLSPEEALLPIDDLVVWKHLNQAALATSKEDLERLIYLVEADRGAVPPQGLFLIAKALADKRAMERASVYYIAGQMRLIFDMQRWPSIDKPEDVANIEQENKKLSDQKAPNIREEARKTNPHRGIKSLAESVGGPINTWLMKDPRRLDKALKLAQAWDESAPYAYLPNYRLTPPAPFETWEKLLLRSRDVYFGEMAKVLSAMKQVKR
jgi:hypothetical protein